MKKIIALAILLSLVSLGSRAQLKLGVAYPTPSSSTGIPWFTGNGSSRVAIPYIDYMGIFTGDGFVSTSGGLSITHIQGQPYTATSPTTGQVRKWDGTNWVPYTFSKADFSLSNVDNTSDVNKPVSMAQAAAINAKLSNITGLIIGPGVASGNGTPGNPYVINTSGSGSGSGSGNSEPHYRTLPYASALNVNFASDSNYAITATGNITFSNTGAGDGQFCELVITKNTSSNINLYFPSTSWAVPYIFNNAAGMAVTIQSPPPGFTLTGASGSVYTILIKYISSTKVGIYLNNFGNFYDPIPLATNMVTLDGQAAFVDPGNTTAETSVYHLKITGGLMKPKSEIKLDFWPETATSGETTVQFKVRVGPSLTPTANSIMYDFGQQNFGAMPAIALFTNNSSTSSQISIVQYNAWPNNAGARTNLTVDTSNDFYIDVTVKKNVGTNKGGVSSIKVTGSGL